MDKNNQVITTAHSVAPHIVEQFDEIVESCTNAGMQVAKSLAHDLTLMSGIEGLKRIFELDEVKTLVLAAAGNEAGFLCDKPSKRDSTLYTYPELVAALIPRLLEGYRLTGNEINIIAGKGMPVKRGKFRRIIELTDGFQETIGVPTQKKDAPGFIFVRCSAKWNRHGERQSIGINEDDPCVLKIKYNPDRYDTMDKVLGLAQSKLYSRVLTRITGAFIADEPESIDITSDVEDHGDTKHKKPIPRKRNSAASLPADETSTVDYAARDEEKTELSPIVQELADLFNDPEHAEAFANLPHDEIRYAISRNNADAAENFLMEAKIGG